MAIARGQISTEGNEIKRYIGVAPCFVKGVCPSKAEMELAFNTQLENEPEYTGEREGTPYARVTFLVQPDPEKVGFDTGVQSISLFIEKQHKFNKDKTKIQVIDKYGRTAWVTSDELKEHKVPVYSNGPANLDKDYRPVYNGEEALTDFLVSYLNIPSVQRYNQTEKKWYMVDNPQDCECRLDNIEEFFKGNFKELKEILTYQPQNKLKILFGVRTNDEGKQYQAVFTRMFMKNSVSTYDKLSKELKSAKENGAYSTTEFEVCPLREYKVEATDLSQGNNASLPFDAPATNPFESPF